MLQTVYIRRMHNIKTRTNETTRSRPVRSVCNRNPITPQIRREVGAQRRIPKIREMSRLVVFYDLGIDGVVGCGSEGAAFERFAGVGTEELATILQIVSRFDSI